MRTNIQVYSMI